MCISYITRISAIKVSLALQCGLYGWTYAPWNYPLTKWIQEHSIFTCNYTKRDSKAMQKKKKILGHSLHTIVGKHHLFKKSCLYER